MPLSSFEAEKRENIERLAADQVLTEQARALMHASARYKYTYNFTWMGLPIIQFPQDLVALQELIFAVEPDLIIETGIAHGGGLVFYASMLELLGGRRTVVGVDVDIRAHNRVRIEAHPMAKRIVLIEGSSISDEVVARVTELAAGYRRPMVMLDSNHAHDHVLDELQRYSPLVHKDSYVVVFDTSIEADPDGMHTGKPWGKGNNPHTAVQAFLRANDRFVIDRATEGKLLLTVCMDGYLRCVRD